MFKLSSKQGVMAKFLTTNTNGERTSFKNKWASSKLKTKIPEKTAKPSLVKLPKMMAQIYKKL